MRVVGKFCLIIFTNHFRLDHLNLYMLIVQIAKGTTGQYLSSKLVKIWLKIDKYNFQTTREFIEKNNSRSYTLHEFRVKLKNLNLSTRIFIHVQKQIFQ